MNFAANEYAQVVEAIHNEVFSEDIVRLLRDMIAHEKASELMKNIISFEKVYSKSNEETIYKLLDKLELLASSKQTVACVLMAQLWPYANNLFLHDVCDAIDLWISECDSKELIEQLHIQALSEQDAGMQRHYENWIKR